MSTIKNASIGMILHRIRIRLYPNNLRKVEGAFIAKTNNEKTLTVEDICASMKTRGGFNGNFAELVEYVREYNDEVAYQLCDGYAVTNGYYTIHPNIGGVFNSVNETHDPDKHPISFRFGVRNKLRDLIKNIAVDVEGIADTNGYIESFMDYGKGYAGENFLPGDQFVIHGRKIKLAGDDPSVGIYFVPVGDPSKAIKVTLIAENFPSRITGIVPDIKRTQCRLEIRTQYSGSGSILLKAPRTIISGFIIDPQCPVQSAQNNGQKFCH